jgi:hypothetical protein
VRATSRQSAGLLLAILGGAPPSAHVQSIGVERSPAPRAAATSVAPVDAGDQRAILARWGVRIESMRLTASGYMLDFRYRVVDARKARPLFARRTRPLLRDERTGTVMLVPTPPKTGALRNSNEPKAGRSYFMFFANPARLVAPGHTVTVTIGDFSVSGIRVSPPDEAGP